MSGAFGRKSRMVIRLSLRGCTNRPFYHINVMTNKQGRDKKAKYQLGVYDPMPNIHGETVVSMDFDKLRHYLRIGVEPTKPVAQLLGLSGYFPIHPTTKLKAYRIQRKKQEDNIKAKANQEQGTPV